MLHKTPLLLPITSTQTMRVRTWHLKHWQIVFVLWLKSLLLRSNNLSVSVGYKPRKMKRNLQKFKENGYMEDEPFEMLSILLPKYLSLQRNSGTNASYSTALRLQTLQQGLPFMDFWTKSQISMTEKASLLNHYSKPNHIVWLKSKSFFLI